MEPCKVIVIANILLKPLYLCIAFDIFHLLDIVIFYILAFNLGKGVLLGASAFGIGSLCYYGLGLASEPGAIEKSM